MMKNGSWVGSSLIKGELKKKKLQKLKEKTIISTSHQQELLSHFSESRASLCITVAQENQHFHESPPKQHKGTENGC